MTFFVYSRNDTESLVFLDDLGDNRRWLATLVASPPNDDREIMA
jgi:hypothetical protein